jgi:magnesium-transporting ATPase (P-type)
MTKISNIGYVSDEGLTDRSEMGWLIVQLIGTWILLLNNFVPISLSVQTELVKFWQSGFMTREAEMFDVRENLKDAKEDEENMPMQASASNLVDELGHVDYVFSDKTGTLTQNIMEFRRFTAGDISYGDMERPDDPNFMLT